MSEIFRHCLANGLWLLAEPVEGAASLAMSLLTPSGVAYEPAGQQGAAALLAEMVCRGTIDRDARAHSEALDQLGVQRGTAVETRYLHLGATMIGQMAAQAMPLLLDMIRRPRLDPVQLEPSRELAVSAIDSLEDEPEERMFVRLRGRHIPAPFGRSLLGEREDLLQIDAGSLRRFWERTASPAGSVLAFAGKFDWPALRDQVEALLGDWSGEPLAAATPMPAQRGYLHDPADSQQVHIGLAYDAPPEVDPASVMQRVAVAALSGGMSGRLFTEVREKRGLCYAVFARYAGDRERGLVLAYAGTSPPRAQETLDVLVEQLRGVSDGISQEEFDRAVVGMKSNLVMQGESTSARAHAIAGDQAELGRPRTLDEQRVEIEAVSLEGLNEYLRTHVPGAGEGAMTIVTTGPAALNVPA
ncbi:MAG: insulinase family protein [Phycisphaeraceae bacterium]|nr:insulinase family protein [Phycisphaeraceae bacterium]